MELTPDTAAKQWVAYVSDTMQLLVLHELDAEMAAPLLAAHMSNAVAWLLCFYYFNTQGGCAIDHVLLLEAATLPAELLTCICFVSSHMQRFSGTRRQTERDTERYPLAQSLCLYITQQLSL